MSKWRALRAGLIKLGPQIATGIGIGLALLAGIKAVEKTPEAIKLIEKKKEEEHKDELTPMETVEATWKCYILPIIMFIIACVLIIGGQRVSTRRALAAATACSLSESKLQKILETEKAFLGDKKMDELQTERARYEIKNNPPGEDIVITGRGDALFYDVLHKRYFKSDPTYVDKAISRLNFRLLDEMYVSVNDYWSEMGLPTTKLGEMLCWSVNDGSIDPGKTVILVDSGPYEGYPCRVMDFYVCPSHNYNDRY